ncbi:hypothetical protein CTAYLR_000306 [Chrysophaeum taylorii]|uniref:SF-assemblin n=1 Tax=Chrysophaeum taylorii TaxID=2483200 RepID=A0AAD7UFB7_9STRA|nr:hypothetical protein CTAYLR_000306 [Chrysophaeum taylorii]
MPDVKNMATGQKLQELLEGFEPFEQTMLQETRERREKDVKKIAETKAEIQRLEEVLEASAKHQDQGHRELIAHCDAELKRADAAFDSLLEHQIRRVHERLDKLERRAGEIESHFDDEKRRIHKEVNERSCHLSKLLDEFQAAFDRECQDRLEREARIIAQMEQHEGQVEAKFAQERKVRQTKLVEIHNELTHLVASRRSSNIQLWAVTAREIEAIQAAIDAEITSRELFDDKIIKAMNQYTNKLQSSLTIITSPDTTNG